ncbi:hypothetical protein B0J11DRAFT_573690 [Dendryphion nanum]|uniref:Uncharacterized protein n=1 Tax=Dendryphion nanum TaxID=256645 RepID=A0A9P9I6I9_9PLEO|nr:hypothetical protein B0J11DRAFT_573690 [Dendryphion nanum]
MKLSNLVAAIVAVAPGAFARNCRKDYYYCGKTLLDIGDYIPQIHQALNDYGCDNPSGSNMRNTLFYCLGGPDGDIAADKICKECQDNGHGDDDTCGVSGGTCGNRLGRLGHHRGQRIEVPI